MITLGLCFVFFQIKKTWPKVAKTVDQHAQIVIVRDGIQIEGHLASEPIAFHYYAIVLLKKWED